MNQQTLPTQESPDLRVFTHRLISIQEEERWMISRKLHDEAGQTLTALMINLDMLRLDMPQEQNSLQKRIDDCIDLVHETIDLIRVLAQDLRPPSLDTLGLNLTLEGYCQDFMRRTKIPVRYHGFEPPPVSDEKNITLYRFLQGGLAHIASRVDVEGVSVRLEQQDEWLRLTIAGSPASKPHPVETVPVNNLEPNGLSGMTERFNLLGGEMEFETQGPSKTCLIGCLPIQEELDWGTGTE